MPLGVIDACDKKLSSFTLNVHSTQTRARTECKNYDLSLIYDREKQEKRISSRFACIKKL